MKFIEFIPLYKERVWGGRRLNESLKRALPDEGKYGESWEIVDRMNDQSVVKDGFYKDLTIRQLLFENSASLMGPNWSKEKPFPILVKWLDCQERLSIQVHPPKRLEHQLGGESKTENWYIAEALPNASVYAGVQNEVSPEIFREALEKENLESHLHRIPTNKGDSLFIPSGRLHAIAEGNLILEIQENSDTTYRVYDWNRVGLDGKQRELHIEESMLSIDFNDVKPSKIASSHENSILANCPEFRIQKINLQASPILLPENKEPKILCIVDGTLKVTDAEGVTILQKGTNILLPYCEHFILEAIKNCTILLVDHFN